MKKAGTSFAILTLTGYLLTVLTLFWGAPFLRVLWSRFGSRLYWLAGIILSFTLVDLWFYMASVWILIGLFSELESRGARWLWNGLLSLGVSSVIFAAGSWNELRSNGITTTPQLAETAKTFLNNSTALTLPEDFNIEGLIHQLPSVVFICMVLTLGHGLIFEKSIYRWFHIPRERFAAQIRLLEFKLPDSFVWIGMFSFLGAIQLWPGQDISKNILNICVALFFFQGLAVLEYFFKALRVGIFVRALGYFLFVFQLFVVLAFVGFVDFWIDFRSRLRKMIAKAQTTGM